MALHAPEIVYDLPAGGKRFIQRAEGYRATIKRGAVAFRDGEAVLTQHDALRGKLLRGAQAAPSA
jgi:N-acyl-D-aspartate/D-glutamate deacylase